MNTKHSWTKLAKLGLPILVMSLAGLAYGAVASWEIQRAINGPFWTLEDFAFSKINLAQPSAREVDKLSALAKKVHEKVCPGKMSWHESFEAACQASKKSGKPVFLFHLLGRLDQRFC